MSKAKKKVAALPPGDVVRVYPAQSMLDRGDYLAGVGAAGADVSPELAAEWLAAGLVSLEPPAAPPEQPEA